MLLKYAGVTADLVPTLDDAYGYVCTCIADINGLKGMLGASAESSAAFSYCSEAAEQEMVKGEKVAAETKVKR